MATIIGKAMSRRNLLRGMGASVALPFLDIMAPRSLRGRGAITRPHRFQAVYCPNGMAMPYWTPTVEGMNPPSEFDRTTDEPLHISPTLEPLADFRNQIIQFSGLNTTWYQLHAGAATSFLTGCPMGGRNETEILGDVGMDQLLASEWGKETQLPSLELAMDPAAFAGACTGILSCVYTSTISWRSRTQPLPMEYNPRAVFERLFGDSGSTERAARAKRLTQQQSILDFVMDGLTSLDGQLGSQDKIKMEQYTEAVRDVELRIGLAEQQIDLELPEMDQPMGAPRDYGEHMELMWDLQVLALQTDLTRVITFMVGKEQSGRQYPQAGVPEAHHPLSHHNNTPLLVEQLAKINRYHTSMFAGYLRKLQATPDIEGSLLDNMTILYGAGMSNSTQHNGNNLPVMLVGGGAGTLKGGRHLTYAGRPVIADLLVTLMDKFGLPVDRIGASKGKVRIDTPIETLSGV